MRITATIAAALFALAASLPAAQVVAQTNTSSEDANRLAATHEAFGATGEVDPDVAPGVDFGYSPFPEREIEIVRPFGDISDSRDQHFAPLNEFAGQSRRADPGLLGEALGRVKQSVAGAFSSGSLSE